MTCGQHRADDGVSYLVYDLNNVPFARVCDKCRRGRGERHWSVQHAEALIRHDHLRLFRPSL
jgi:hypothetical protein